MPTSVPANVPFTLDDPVVVVVGGVDHLLIDVPPDPMTVDVPPDPWTVDVPPLPSM